MFCFLLHCAHLCAYHKQCTFIPVVVVVVDNDDVFAVIVTHLTWEVSGLHIPSSSHNELLLEGTSPDSSHW